ncbi:hypothetical protein BgiBS90_015520, partial [Biomphalaria glabrata]
ISRAPQGHMNKTKRSSQIIARKKKKSLLHLVKTSKWLTMLNISQQTPHMALDGRPFPFVSID